MRLAACNYGQPHSLRRVLLNLTLANPILRLASDFYSAALLCLLRLGGCLVMMLRRQRLTPYGLY
jgi:hypothetical protein